jgi:hypothetical protein
VSDAEALQEDLAELLRVTGLGDHARSASPHDVMQHEVLPRVRSVFTLARELCEGVEREGMADLRIVDRIGEAVGIATGAAS